MLLQIIRWLTEHRLRSLGGGLFCLMIFLLAFSPFSTNSGDEIATYTVTPLSFLVEVRSVGELEAARSISISSLLRGEQAKIIELIADGTQVQSGDLLARIDSTHLERRIVELEAAEKECRGRIVAHQQQIAWEGEQAEHDKRAALIEKESLELELHKVVEGDGPMELSKLKAAMQKAKAKYDDLHAYWTDLISLEEQGYLNPVEVRQTEKKLLEEEEGYQSAKLQYESFVHYVHPMQIKRAETLLKKAITKLEEVDKACNYRISKAESSLFFAEQEKEEIERQLAESKEEIKLAEIRAPAPGMVVHREEFRGTQRRKPRVGDLVIRNQPILDLPDLTSMIVKTKVREIDLHKIEIGKEATLEVDAFPHLYFHGKVIYIGILALSDFMKQNDEKYFEVKIALDQTDPRLRPGMTARVVIHADRVEKALAIPIHAVFEKDRNYFVYLKTWKGFIPTPIDLGRSNEQFVEVLSGLQENDEVSLSLPL